MLDNFVLYCMNVIVFYKWVISFFYLIGQNGLLVVFGCEDICDYSWLVEN